MRRFYTLLAAVVVAAALGYAPAQAEGYVNQADVDTIDKALEVYSAFAKETGNNASTADSVKAKAALAATEFGVVASHSFATGLGDAYTREAAALKQEATALKAQLDKAPTVIGVGDEAAVNAYLDGLDAAAAKFDTQMGKLNGAVDESNNATGNNYLWMVIAAAVLTAGAFVWAFVLSKQKQLSDQLGKARKGIAYASLAPLAGALITYVSYMFADKLGGSYIIAYGPVVFGVIILAQAVVNYVKLVKSGA